MNKNYNNSTYLFVGKMALEFRLSLNNVCKLLGWEQTEENGIKFYTIIEKLIGSNSELLAKYKYLFFVETCSESEKASRIEYMTALNFLNRYKKATKDNDMVLIEKLNSELERTEINFKNTLLKLKESKLDNEDIVAISKYRVKNAIAREPLCQIYGIGIRALINGEKNLQSNILKEKIETLSTYLSSVYLHSKR